MNNKLASFLTALTLSGTLGVRAQGTAFTYQGRLNDGANPASGIYDLRFTIYDAASNGAQQGSALTNAATGVTNGLFTVTLDFGNQFPGAERWLEIGVCTNGGGAFTTLVPRQQFTATPYAITAGNVTGPLPAAQLTGTVPAAQLAGTYSGAVTFDNAGNSFTGDGSGLAGVNAATLGGLSSASFWQLTGNPGTTPGTHFLGTTDNQPLEVKVNGARAWRVEPASSGAPNLIGGASVNSVGAGVIGATIGGGGAADYLSYYVLSNRVDADFGTIGGGVRNIIQTNASRATLGGGMNNTIQPDAYGATLGGGYNNTIQSNACLATLGGGSQNTIQTNSQYTTLGGGYNNTIQDYTAYATLGGGQLNAIGAGHATLGGGYNNTIGRSALHATLGGGSQNTIQTGSTDATLGGGTLNTIKEHAYYSTLGGGTENTIEEYAYYATLGGGWLNTIQAYTQAGTIGGGWENTIPASVWDATIAGGAHNWAKAIGATVGGGSGNNAEGILATCPGGDRNWAKGDRSFAAGSQAKALGRGAFVWADGQDPEFAPATANEVSFRCENGVIFTKDSGYSKYVQWTPASGSWTFGSDRNSKDHIVPVDGGDVLEKVAQLPISEWNYKGYAQRHVGPMAQDFHALFPLNDDDKTLNETDLHGVALAAIRGLNDKVESGKREAETQIEELKAENAALKRELAGIKRLIESKLSGGAK